MQDRVSLYPGRVTLTPVAGQANTYDMVRADQPTQEGTQLNKGNLLSDATAELLGLPSTAVPNDAFTKIANAKFGWKLIQEYKTAGSYTFTVPAGVSELGVYMIGGGGSGGANTTTSGTGFYASGGAAGYGKNIILAVTPGQQIPVVVGAKGAGAYSNSTNGTQGNAGGTTSVHGETVYGGEGGNGAKSSPSPGAKGGQGSDPSLSASGMDRKLYGSVPTAGDTYGANTYTAQDPRESQNVFDPTMVSLCAGGCAYKYGNPQGTSVHQGMLAMPDGTKGGDGIVTGGTSGNNNATGNGNGGGAVVSSDYCTSGAGSDGAVYIYARSASA